jgi:hypothetical protein
MLIDELIEKAFCDGYEYAQKEFARADYAGLSRNAANALRAKRSEYARSMLKNYRDNQKGVANFIKSQGERHIASLNTKASYTGGGVRSRLEVNSRFPADFSKNYQIHNNEAYNTHLHGKDGITENMLGASRKAKALMRRQVIEG